MKIYTIVKNKLFVNTLKIVIQLGGPLIADSTINTSNKTTDDNADVISYLVGIVSFGPQFW